MTEASQNHDGSALDPEPPPARHDPYQVLRDGNFARFLTAALLLRIGAQMQTIAVGWEIYERTRSALALGMVGLAQVAPVLLLAIPSGHLSDRHDRKMLFVASNVLMLIAAVGLAVVSAYEAPVDWIYVLLVITGIGQALNRPTRWAIQPMLVPRDLLLSAITWSSSVGQIASVGGPALGGFVIAATAKATACYSLNAVFLAFAVALNASLRIRPTVRDASPVTLQTLLAGLRFVLKTDLLLATMTLDMVAVLLGGATALLPIYARDILKVGPEGLGWLRAAPSVGSFATALALAHRKPIQRAGPVILWSVAGFGAATIVFGLSRNFHVSLAALVFLGACDNVSVVVRQTLSQMLSPDDMRGRVSAINTIFVSSSNELGEFESGVVARLVGAVGAVVLGGVGTLVTVVGIALIWPNLRKLGSLQDVAPANPDSTN
ncbi:MAG: MFS transporter [Paludisphaera borealis]|uniref:MFS transporter n=1 Tax=Paludisphaera borealis TaxID=1387353 RepID=UPI0028430FEF|nr:MFS transporter [Paludisphaera borealis]MDR3618160.1 MFS transporter [Paludisphaera borealis]